MQFWWVQEPTGLLKFNSLYFLITHQSSKAFEKKEREKQKPQTVATQIQVILLTYHIGHSKFFCIAESTFCTSPTAITEKSIFHSRKNSTEKSNQLCFWFVASHEQCVVSWLFYNMLISTESLAALFLSEALQYLWSSCSECLVKTYQVSCSQSNKQNEFTDAETQQSHMSRTAKPQSFLCGKGCKEGSRHAHERTLRTTDPEQHK